MQSRDQIFRRLHDDLLAAGVAVSAQIAFDKYLLLTALGQGRRKSSAQCGQRIDAFDDGRMLGVIRAQSQVMTGKFGLGGKSLQAGPIAHDLLEAGGRPLGHADDFLSGFCIEQQHHFDVPGQDAAPGILHKGPFAGQGERAA